MERDTTMSGELPETVLYDAFRDIRETVENEISTEVPEEALAFDIETRKTEERTVVEYEISIQEQYELEDSVSGEFEFPYRLDRIGELTVGEEVRDGYGDELLKETIESSTPPTTPLRYNGEVLREIPSDSYTEFK